MEHPSNVYAKRQSLLGVFGRFVLTVAVITAIEAAILAGICWWAGLDDTEDVSSVLLIGGAAFALLGAGTYVVPRGSSSPIGGLGMGTAVDVQRAGMLAEHAPAIARQDAIDARRGLGISVAIFVASALIIAGAVVAAVAG